MVLFYILAEDGKTPIATQDMALVAQQRNNFEQYIVAKSYSKNDALREMLQCDEVTVSTVFLGLDHRMFGEGPPILFETLVFGGPNDGRMERYCTWEEAERGHKVMCGIVGIAWSNHEDKGSMTA